MRLDFEMGFARAVLGVSGLLFAAIGMVFLVDPLPWAAKVDLVMPTSTAVTDIRAVYGGLDLGLGSFLIWCVCHIQRVKLGLVAGLMVFGGLFMGRLWGVLATGDMSEIIVILGFIEGLGIILHGVALWNMKR